MDKNKALQKLLNGTASEEDINLLKGGLATGEISIGGNVNRSVIIIGSGNTVELPPEAVDQLNARPLLGGLDRDLTGDEIALGLQRLEFELPLRAPVLLAPFQEQARHLRPSLKTSSASLSQRARQERVEALAVLNSLCIEALDISFNSLCLGEEPPEYDARSPFRGLESFRPEDSEFFFGRETLTQKIVAKIRAHPFLAVLGASGSGKSSLVMAGFVPACGMDYAIFRPGTDPLGALEAANEKALIVVDQFEELFTLTRDETTRRQFIAELLKIAKRARVVLTLRSDFLGEVAAHRNLNEEVQNHLENVPLMDMNELHRAMEAQARAVRLTFEADLSQQILDDVEGEPGAMPLLQHALWELWNRRHGGWLRASEYRAFGGVKQAITSTAENVYGSCTADEQEQMRDIFLRLTRLDENDEGRDTRRRIAMSELVHSGGDAASITLLLDNLANERLIVKTVNAETIEIELAHEALIRHWERLRLWLNEDRDQLRLRESVSEDAKAWVQAGRDEALLNHRGGRLEDALALGQSTRYGLNEIEQSYLRACWELAARERQSQLRLQRRILIGVVSFSIIVLILLVNSISQLNVSRGERLGFQSRVAFFDGDYNTAGLYAYQSNKIHENESATLVLEQLPYQNFALGKTFLKDNSLYFESAWSQDGRVASYDEYHDDMLILDSSTGKIIQRLNSPEGGIPAAAWSSDGRLASASDDHNIIIWDLSTGKPSQILKGHTGKINDIAWSSDGRLASGSQDNAVILWDLSVGKPQRVLEGHTNFVNAVAWSNNGQLASGSGDNTIILWDVSSGQPQMILKGHTDYIGMIAWSAGGRLASGSGDNTIILWDVSIGQPQMILKGHEAYVTSLAWSANGQLASGAGDNNVILWNLATGQPAQILRGQTNSIKSLTWLEGGKLASASLSGDLVIWSVTIRQPARTLKEHTNTVSSLDWSAYGQLASGSLDGTVVVWDLEREQPVLILRGHTDAVNSVAWSEDGRLASGSEDGTVILWDLSTGQPTQILKGHSDSVSGVAWSRDEQLASASFKGDIIIWDLSTGQPAQKLNDRPILYSQDVFLWDGVPSIYSLAWSEDGRLAAGSMTGMVAIWDLQNPLYPQILMSDNISTNHVAWSQDGLLASITSMGQAALWDLSKSESAQTFSSFGMSDLAWSPDGRLASASSDGTIIWDLRTGESAQILKGHAGTVSSVSWSRDGILASGGYDNLVRIARSDLIGLEPCQWLLRNMTEQEWLDTQGYLFTYQPACPNLPSYPVNSLLTWRGRLLGLAAVLVLIAVGWYVWNLILKYRLQQKVKRAFGYVIAIILFVLPFIYQELIAVYEITFLVFVFGIWILVLILRRRSS